MNFLEDPFFWAFISMFAVILSSQIVGRSRLGRSSLFGAIVVGLFALGRIILVLPALPQPRFDIGTWHWILGSLIFSVGIVFGIAAFFIKPFTAPDETVMLKTTGLYGIVRNPLYLAELLWSLGWSILFQSLIGTFLTLFWWVSLLCIALIEEESLTQVLGQPYLEYKDRVKSRIIPGLPF